jgi:hypothetical protein
MDSPDDLIPDSEVARRYGVHIKTIARWDDYPQLDFPAPIVITNRKYRRNWTSPRLSPTENTDAVANSKSLSAAKS